jgi:uncharacterized protein DUF6152
VKLQTLFKPALASAALLAALLAGAPALAHHSTAMFEWGKEKSLEGTIDKFEWTQPHAFVWVNVPDKNGKMQSWGFEGMSPSWLGRRGWNGKSLKAGEKVKLDYYPLKDGRNGGFFVRVKLPTGNTLEALPSRPAGEAAKAAAASK